MSEWIKAIKQISKIRKRKPQTPFYASPKRKNHKRFAIIALKKKENETEKQYVIVVLHTACE